MQPGNRKLQILGFAISVCGGIALFQGASIARLDESAVVESQFNSHALLIAGCGLGLLCCGYVIRVPLNRLQAIEDEISRQKDSAATRWFASTFRETSHGDSSASAPDPLAPVASPES